MIKSINSYAVLKGVVVIFVFFLSLQVKVFAQETSSSENSSIQLLDSYIGAATNPDAIRLKDLVYEVQASVYFYTNQINTYGSAPVNLYTDFNGISRLPEATFEKETIELITIRIENSSQILNKLNLSNLSAFPKLKYVYILTTFPYSLEQISKIITNSNKNYIVVYKSDMGS